MNSLIKIAVVLAFAAVASGNLPAVINQVRKAQFQLNQESKRLQFAKGDDSAWQIVSQSQDFSVVFWNSL